MYSSEEIFAPTLLEIESLRIRESNKGTYGHAYIIGGSFSYSGAPYLSYGASAAYRMGIGYAHLAIPKSLVPAYMLKDPQAIITSMDESNGFLRFNKEEFDALMKDAKGIAFGMGAGNNEETAKVAQYLLSNFGGMLLLDADALNSIASYGYLGNLERHVGPLVLTPHLKEFSRLTGIAIDEIEARQKELAKEFAKKWNCVLALKSHRTYVSDGESTYEVSAGNSGLAKAGSGDLLSGLIIGLSWAYPSIPLIKIATLGCSLLGKAAEYVSKNNGGLEFATTAFDIINAIPMIMKNDH